MPMREPLRSLLHVAADRAVHRRAPRRPSPDLANGETYAGEKPAIAFTSRNSSRPNLPHSRPLPDCL